MLRAVGDLDPEPFLAGLAEGIGCVEAHRSVEDLCEAVLARAPASVALRVDDAHRLGNGGPAWEVLVDLVDRLPSNGHLVVSGRRSPRLASLGC